MRGAVAHRHRPRCLVTGCDGWVWSWAGSTRKAGKNIGIDPQHIPVQLGGEPFSSGGGTLRNIGTLRANDIAALRTADNHDFAPLLGFARS